MSKRCGGCLANGNQCPNKALRGFAWCQECRDYWSGRPASAKKSADDIKKGIADWILTDATECCLCGEEFIASNAPFEVRVLPGSHGGTIHKNNSMRVCLACMEQRHETLAIVLPRLVDGHVGKDGCVTWKRWGEWHLMAFPDGGSFVLTFEPDGLDYWIGQDRVHEKYWHSNLERKKWIKESDRHLDDFCGAINFFRSIVEPPNKTNVAVVKTEAAGRVIHLPAGEYEAIEAQARREGVPVEEFVRAACDAVVSYAATDTTNDIDGEPF